MVEKYEELKEVLIIQVEELTYKLDCINKKEAILDSESRLYMNCVMDLIGTLNAKLNSIERKIKELKN